MIWLETTANPEHLAAAMRFARDSAAAAGFEGDDLLRVDLVVEELFLNIALHACPGEAVRVGCASSSHGEVALAFEYPGPEFDPASAGPPPDLEATLADRRIGGLGLFLTRSMAGAVSYSRDGAINRLSVEMRQSPSTLH